MIAIYSFCTAKTSVTNVSLGFNPNQELACNSPTFQLIHPNSQTKTGIDWMLLCASGHSYWFWQSETWKWLGFRVVSEFIVFQNLTIERSSVAHSYSVSSVFFYGINISNVFGNFLPPHHQCWNYIREIFSHVDSSERNAQYFVCGTMNEGYTKLILCYLCGVVLSYISFFHYR